MKYTEEELFDFYINPSEYEYSYCTYCKCEVPVRVEVFEDDEDDTITTITDCEICGSRLDKLIERAY